MVSLSNPSADGVGLRTILRQAQDDNLAVYTKIG
jgi:hypothetical protein